MGLSDQRQMLSFFGAARTVTGSRNYLDLGSIRVLVDCGMFQGKRSIRTKNWEPFPMDASKIDCLILTHAHIDHSGYIPKLIEEGFRGPIYCTTATKDLCGILLPDSGHIQEHDAYLANKYGHSRHHPAKPLYTLEQAKAAMSQFKSVPLEKTIELNDNVRFRFLNSGHILGSAFVEMEIGGEKIVFSGDLGRPESNLLKPPVKITQTDYLVLESTYGDRLHDKSDSQLLLEQVINRTVGRGGTVVIPSFAVGRAQSLMFEIWDLQQKQRIPKMPVYLDSPMAIDASEIFCNNPNLIKLPQSVCRQICSVAEYTNSVDASKALDNSDVPMILISASGMATGGRVLFHLRRFAPQSRNTILFAGFQAEGTRGAKMIRGQKTVRIHGIDVPIRAEVVSLSSLSAHADRDEILGWLENFQRPPKTVFINHGEIDAAESLKSAIESKFGWHCHIPKMEETVLLK